MRGSHMHNEFWNARYAEPGYAYGTAPNAFLASQARLLQPRTRALAVADGEGRNGVWLAEQGLDVLSVDASDVGLRKAQTLAAERQVALRTDVVNLFDWAWPEARFDVVVAIFAHFPPGERARMHASMLQALKPGGLLILEAFTPQQLQYQSGGPRAPEMLYTADMLRSDFAGAAIEELAETVTDLDEGPFHRGRAAVVRLLARRAG
jgi:2-polyprenyl-3-methyl-5-hydroxy-6-metoxy-1,4-benzoquinol methylase